MSRLDNFIVRNPFKCLLIVMAFWVVFIMGCIINYYAFPLRNPTTKTEIR